MALLTGPHTSNEFLKKIKKICICRIVILAVSQSGIVPDPTINKATCRALLDWKITHKLDSFNTSTELTKKQVPSSQPNQVEPGKDLEFTKLSYAPTLFPTWI